MVKAKRRMAIFTLLVIVMVISVNCTTSSNETQMWREDNRCGEHFTLTNGSEAQCDPEGDSPCCSKEGWCGNKEHHCECDSCVDYRANKDKPSTYVMKRMKRSPRRSQGRSQGRARGRSKGRQQGRSLGRKQGRSKGRTRGRSQGRQQGRSLGQPQGRSQGRSQGLSRGGSKGHFRGRSNRPSNGRFKGRSGSSGPLNPRSGPKNKEIGVAPRPDESTTYQSLGCFKDAKPIRAIAGRMFNFKPGSTTIERCYEKALSEGNSHFGVQYYTECYTHRNAGSTYARYGRTTGCRDGRGGSFKMNVYQIVKKDERMEPSTSPVEGLLISGSDEEQLEDEPKFEDPLEDDDLDDYSDADLIETLEQDKYEESKDELIKEKLSEKKLNVVYANEEKGSTNDECGSSKAPCKYLKDAVEKCAGRGKVIVQGDHNLTSEIRITDSVSILGQGEATIRGSSTNQFVFKVVKEIGLSLVKLNFQECAVVSIESKATINITDCTVAHTLERKEKRNRYGSIIRPRPSELYAIIKVLEEKEVVITVFNCTFRGVEKIPVLYDASPRASSVASISFTRCTFFNNSGILWNYRSINLHLRNCTFTKSRVFIDGFFPRPFIDLTISGCTFNSTVGGAMFVGGRSKVNISDNVFKNCLAKVTTQNVLTTYSGGAISIDGRRGKGSLIVIKRCLFKGNVHGYTLTGRGGADIRLHNVSGAVIEDCYFLKSQAKGFEANSIQYHGGAIFIAQATVNVTNCMFERCSAKGKGGAVMIKNIKFLPCNSQNCKEEPIQTQSEVEIRNCTFRDNEAGSEGGAILAELGGVLRLHSCNFEGNTANQGGAVMIRLFERDIRVIQAMISNTSFIENKAGSGGALYLDRNKNFWKPITISEIKPFFFGSAKPSHSIHLADSVFTNNSADSSGQSVFNNGNLKMNNVKVSSTEMLLGSHLHSERGNIELSSIDMELSRDKTNELPKINGIFLSSSEIRLSNGLNLSCPMNFKIDMVKNTTGTVIVRDARVMDRPPQYMTVYKLLQVDCVSCPVGSYTMQHGFYHVPNLQSTKNKIAYNATIHNPHCMKCPTGAICSVNVEAMDNFWGYTDGSILKFELCPRGFCCSSLTTPCTSYDTCAVGRKGTLCGTCAKGYKQNFVGGNCIPKGHECDINVFITYFVVYTVVYTVVFILITNMKDIITVVKSFRAKKRSQADSEETEKDKEASDEESDTTFSAAGFVQIVILYFQVAGLLQVKFQGGSQRKEGSGHTEGLREDITNFFNFRFTVYQEVCPSEDLTLPQKEMFLFSMKLATFVFLFLLAIIHRVVKNLLCWSKSIHAQTRSTSIEEPSIELMSATMVEEDPVKKSETTEEGPTIAFSSMLKFTFIKLLKLYYTPIVNSALMLIHCVNIRNESRLYVFGDHACYSGWQIGIIIILLPSLLLFPMCFEFAVRLLKERLISSWQFVLAALCPLYSIFLYFSKRKVAQENDEASMLLSQKEESFRATILEGEESLFREVGSFTMGWTVIQFYRTFAMSAVNTFFTNPFYRLMAYILLVQVFVIHDRDRQPFKNAYLNILQSLTSRCLIVVIVCNIIPAMSYLVNVQSVPSILQIVEVLGVIELIVYAVVPLSLPIWKLKTFIDDKQNEKETVQKRNKDC